MRPLLAATSIALALIANIAHADNSQLIKFTRANAEKFLSEVVEVVGLGIDSKILVDGFLDGIDLLAVKPQYDDATGELVVVSPIAYLSSLQISEICKKTGTFPAQNSFGAKTVVRQQTCERFVVQESNSSIARLAGARLKMTPSQFRDIQKRGVRARFEFTIRFNSKKETVIFSDHVEEATIKDPVQSRMKVWQVYGNITEILLILPGESQAITFWRRM